MALIDSWLSLAVGDAWSSAGTTATIDVVAFGLPVFFLLGERLFFGLFPFDYDPSLA